MVERREIDLKLITVLRGAFREDRVVFTCEYRERYQPTSVGGRERPTLSTPSKNLRVTPSTGRWKNYPRD